MSTVRHSTLRVPEGMLHYRHEGKGFYSSEVFYLGWEEGRIEPLTLSRNFRRISQSEVTSAEGSFATIDCKAYHVRVGGSGTWGGGGNL